MKLKPIKLAPALIAGCVIVVVCVLRLFNPDPVQRLENMTYDLRVRAALNFSAPVATNFGFVYISDQTIDEISKGLMGNSYGLYWPRHIYGRVIRELAAQHARAAAIDVIFAEQRSDHAAVPVSTAQWPSAADFAAALHPGKTIPTYEDNGEKLLLMESDDYFAWQLKRSGIAILAAERGVRPNDLFATNAAMVADISAGRDTDGILRRARAFQVYHSHWHPLFQRAAADPEYAIDLREAFVTNGAIMLPRKGLDAIRVPIDAETNFALADFLGDKLPPGWPAKAKAFTDERVWHMGIALAAKQLNLDLSKSEVDLAHGRITLRGTGGVERIIPVDRSGYFYINWELPYDDLRLMREPFESLLKQDMARNAGQTNGLSSEWKDKLAVIGSMTVGNDLSDRGATPLESDTLLASEHWNIANSIVTGRFIDRSGLAADLLLIAAMGILAGLLTWQLRAIVASLLITLSLLGYVGLAFFLYVHNRYWLPIFLPGVGAMLMTYVCVLIWRVVFEQAEQRRLKSIFSTVVSPKIMNELLRAERLKLGGARREVTVLFADVRGFTEFTDGSQERAAAYVAENKLSGPAAESYFDNQARETLATINLYLGLVADTIIQRDATLDKFIGDCVMAFWGAPTPNSQHAAACVRAAIDAQRAVYELNLRRAAENKRLEIENLARTSAGLQPKTLLPILLLGSGINTGVVTVGIMGSESTAGVRHGNYTVFGREVNLASRLESLSGRGRIIISQATYERLRTENPELAATCVALPDAMVKGIRSAVKVYEVPWRTPEAPEAGPVSDPKAGSVGSSTEAIAKTGVGA